MRFYYWGNYYLSSIQQGIQALHTTAECFVKYSAQAGAPGDSSAVRENMLLDWADNHKTVVLLGGQASEGLREIAEEFREAGLANSYPWATFHEDGVEDAITCVGICVPDLIYNAVNEVKLARRQRRRFDFGERLSDFDYELVMRIDRSPLAR